MTIQRAFGITRLEADKATKAALIAHTGNMENPHATNKGQIGLSEVDNISSMKPNLLASLASQSVFAVSKENDNGDLIFRTALCHLISVGTQALKDETEVENQIAEINGNTSIGAFFTTDYQLEILNCAVEISAFAPLEILKYIKCNVFCG